LDHNLPFLTEIVLRELKDVGETIESSNQVHASWVINILMKEVGVLVISVGIRSKVSTILVLVVPNNGLRVSMDF
jgi:hypothetical protein